MHKPSNRGKPRNRLRVGANEKITRKCLTLCVTAIPIAIFAALLTFGPFLFPSGQANIVLVILWGQEGLYLGVMLRLQVLL